MDRGFHQELFPTHLFRWDSVFDMVTWDKIFKLKFEDKEKIDIQEINDTIIEATKEIMSIHMIDPEYEIEVTEVWGNVLKPGEDHKFHNHPNNVYSGVLHLTDGEPLVFVDPRGSSSMMLLKHIPNRFIDNMAMVTPRPNTMVMFNSWLHHFVGVNKTSNERKSISFNVVLRGNYGMPNSLSNVRI